jgi:thiol-disulfide isomerase/thioredoxin
VIHCHRFVLLIVGTLLFSVGGYAQQLKNGLIIYPDTAHFTSLDDVLKLPELRNKVVYVDVWGTKCTPCITEFPHLKSTRKKYWGKELAFLFLKTPYGFDDEKAWMKMMKKYKLKGVNIAMSIRFYTTNFWNRYEKFFPAEKIFAIPVYLIIGNDGTILNYNAPRPEEHSALETELNAALSR